MLNQNLTLYKDTQDYNADRELAYRNVEKLQPFYNKEWIVNQGNKLAADSPLMTKEVLSVTAMKGNDFVTDLQMPTILWFTTQIRQKTSLQFHRKNLK